MSKLWQWILVSLVMMVALSPNSGYTEDVSRDVVIISSGELHEGDLRVVGKTVEISGVVTGDLYVIASQLYIDGVVQGDVICAAGLLDISGRVERGVRGAAGQVVISGEVERNISLASASFELTKTALIGRNAILFSGSCDLLGEIRGTTKVFSSFLRVAGDLKGQLAAHVGSLRVTSRAYIGQGIEYFSNDPILLDEGAQINGEITHSPSFIYKVTQHGMLNKVKMGSKIAGVTMNFFFTLILGLILIQFFRPKLNASAKIMASKPFHCLFTGVVIILLLPLIALVFLISIVGAPFALGIIALNVLGFYSAKIVTLYAVGSKALIYWKFDRYPRALFLLLTVVYFIVALIPYIGWITSILFMLLGLGSIVKRASYQKLSM